jgi:hypothetical protein
LNAKLLNTVALTQTFLPTICDFKARVLLLSPNIVASLQLPFHGIENVISMALEGFITTLRRELGTLGIEVCHLKLGTFDGAGLSSKHLTEPIRCGRTWNWSPATRAMYADNYISQMRNPGTRGVFSDSGNGAKGSSIRKLHNAVFDALTQNHPRQTWRVGRGSVAYDLIGNWVPSAIVQYMLGIRRVSLDTISEPKLENSVHQP